MAGFTENFSTATNGEDLAAFTHNGLTFSNVVGGLLFSSTLSLYGTNSVPNVYSSNIATPSGTHIVTYTILIKSFVDGQNSGVSFSDDGTNSNFYWPRIHWDGTFLLFQFVKTVSGSGALIGSAVTLTPVAPGDVLTVTLTCTPGGGNIAFAATITNQSAVTVGTYSFTDSSPVPTASSFFGIHSDQIATGTTGLQFASFGDSVATIPSSGPTAITLSGATSGTVGTPSANITITLDQPAITSTSVALSVATITGTFSPTSPIVFAIGDTSHTFTFNASSAGSGIITASSAGLTSGTSPFTASAASGVATTVGVLASPASSTLWFSIIGTVLQYIYPSCIGRVLTWAPGTANYGYSGLITGQVNNGLTVTLYCQPPMSQTPNTGDIPVVK